MRRHYDQRQDDYEPYEVRTKVWLDGKNIKPFRPMKKLAEKRYGPFEILKLIPPSSYWLKIPPTWKGIHPVFNEVPLTPALTPLPHQSKLRPPPDVELDEMEKYEVEAILDIKTQRKKPWYLVHWKGYGHEENTWEPLSNLMDAKEALKDFRESGRNRPA